MQSTALINALFCFILIAALPKIFFRQDGTYNLKWILTGAPYFLSGLACILSFTGHNPILINDQSTAYLVLQGFSAILFMASVGLMTMTLGTHRIPLALWHQDNDAPRTIVTWGAYKYIRHPFYTSFLLSLLGGVCLAPSFATIAILVYGYVAKNQTAKKEEGKLSASELGAEYVPYIKTTGRFFPKF